MQTLSNVIHGTTIRTVIEDDGSISFSAKDVCNVLVTIKDAQAIQKNCKAKGVSSRDRKSGEQRVLRKSI